MKKKEKRALIGIIIVVGLLFLIAQPKLPFAVGDTTFTPIFCNDYEFTCCNEQIDSIVPKTHEITDEIAWMCPYPYTCEIGNSYKKVGTDFYVGSEGCKLDSSFLGDRWKCDDEVKTSRQILFPGEYIWVMFPFQKTTEVRNNFLYDVKIFFQRLDFCGRSGCTVGFPISGADQCTFHPNYNTIYTSTSSLTGKKTTTSYTVPKGSCVLAFQSGDRYICGYEEESCSIDNDCDGHTYGNVECTGRTKQTYGCRDFGTPIQERDRGPFDSGWGSNEPQTSYNTFGKRCEIVKAETVQCCGDNDCGSNMFCDTSTFTCKQDVECSQDYDCGVSVQCDFSTKKLKTPVCESGTCGYDEESVECCNDQQCASGYFCNVDKECEVRQVSCTQCPFECCEDACTSEGGYFDRACPENRPYCVDGACLVNPPPAEGCESCDDYATSVLIGWASKDKLCEPKLVAIPPQTITTCIFSFLRFILIPITFLFSLLFGIDFLERFNSLAGPKNKPLRVFVAILISAIIAFLVYISFWIGIIVFAVYLLFRLLVGGKIRQVQKGVRRLRR